MRSYKNTLNRTFVMVLVVVNLALAGGASVMAQGKGRAIGKPVGAKSEIVKPVHLEKPARPMPPPSVRHSLKTKTAKPLKSKSVKPLKPKPPKHARSPNHDKRGHKRCVKDCKRAHKNAIRACHGRIGADRAACERAANEAHRQCMRGCPR